MAAQKLFSDFPSGVAGVSPTITSDIAQKSEEDDASTLAGYKKRLELQRDTTADAARAQAQWNRQMALQWEQEDMKQAAEQQRQLDAQRKAAFDLIYAPQAANQIEFGAQLATDQGRSPGGSTRSSTPAQAGAAGILGNTGQNFQIDPASGGVVSGKSVIGGTWHNQSGTMMPGVDPNAVQSNTNQAFNQKIAQQKAQSKNPYY